MTQFDESIDKFDWFRIEEINYVWNHLVNIPDTPYDDIWLLTRCI